MDTNISNFNKLQEDYQQAKKEIMGNFWAGQTQRENGKPSRTVHLTMSPKNAGETVFSYHHQNRNKSKVKEVKPRYPLPKRIPSVVELIQRNVDK